MGIKWRVAPQLTAISSKHIKKSKKRGVGKEEGKGQKGEYNQTK